jgi:colicin import membrane protein
MRPTEFEEKDIIKAGLELVEAGRNVTGFALRQKVGGGNPNRLKQVWDEHQSSQAVVDAEPVAELPHEVAEQLKLIKEALVDRLESLTVDLNDKAVKASERRVADAIHNAGEQRKQMEKELADAITTVDDAENKLDEAKEQIVSLNARIEGQGETLQSLKVEIAQLKVQLQSANQAAAEAATAAADRESDLRAQLAESRRGEQASREREAQAVGQVAAAQKQHEEDALVCSKLRTDVDALKNKLSEQSVELATTKARLDDSVAGLKKSESALSVAEKSRATAVAEAAGLGGEIKQLKEQVAELKKALDSAGAQLKTAQNAKKP